MATISGIRTIELNDEQLCDFMKVPHRLPLVLPEPFRLNDYLVIKFNNEYCGPYWFNGEVFVEVMYQHFDSKHFGTIKPKDKDPYQMAYMDSLSRNQLTFCTGPAGSGKTQLALGYAFQELEKGKLDHIIVFTNPMIANQAVRLGFLPGTRNEKLLESSIGSILISKIGGRSEVERLIDGEELILMPMGDCRGYEPLPNSFVYFTEAQNTSRYLMQLFLQRLTDDCKVCVEGDTKQVDSSSFENGLNGLTRAIEVFRGEDYAGHVRLENIYRGRIAKRAELICEN